MLVLLKPHFSIAQDASDAIFSKKPGTIAGMVVDQDNRPITGVQVTVKGDTASAKTDAKGHFEIITKTGSVLVFQKDDHYAAEAVIQNDKDLKIRLPESYLRNPAKVDVLYNTVDQSKLLSSVSTIYTNQLTTTPSSLFLYALPGQLPGLYTQQTSGFTTPSTGGQTTSGIFTNVVTSHNIKPTDNTEFILSSRGGNGNVITIIDGVQREISSIDPESIESVSVLKDAMSTILLGINSSNTVLLVTTKHAEVGAPRISFTAETGVQEALSMPKPLSAYQYAYLYDEALQNDGKLPIYSAADFAAYRNHTDPTGHPDVDWFGTIMKKSAPITQYKLNVSGGTDFARYTISLSYMDQQGLFRTASDVPYNTNNDLNRYIINSNLSVNVTKKFTVDLQIFGRIQQGTQPGTGYTGILSTLYSLPNNAYPIYNPNGTFGGTSTYTNNLLSQTEYSGYIQNYSHDVLTNLDLKYDLDSFIKGLALKVKGNLSIESQTALVRNLQNQAYLYTAKDSSYSAVGSTVPESNGFTTVTSARYAYAQGALTYGRQFGKSNVSAMAMYDVRTSALTFDLQSQTTNRALTAAYNYDNKYFAEAAVNNSGYNRYPPGHQFGWFYAGGLGWQMGREDFMKDISWIDSWKWRATYGKTGNGNVDTYGYYGYTQTYSSQYAAYPQGTDRSVGYGYTADPLANPNITWEKAHKFDVGADISLLKGQLRIQADYYSNRYYDLLQVRGNSIALLGAAYTDENLGINSYKGEELSITYNNHINNFNYFLTGNISIQKSKIVYSDEEPQPYPWLVQTGQAVGEMYGYQALGLFKTAAEAASSPTTTGYTAQAGDIKYKDQNGDGVINQFDIVPIGNTKPLIYYGGTIGFSYHGFSLSAIIQGVTNRQISIDNNEYNGFDGIGFLGSQHVGQGYEALTNRWTPETANTATLPRLSVGNAIANNTAASSFWIRSGDYVRLKNAEVGYALPYSVCRFLHISGLRVFMNAENIATLSGFKGIDPEVFLGGPYNSNPYPIQRVINGGLSVKL